MSKSKGEGGQEIRSKDKRKSRSHVNLIDQYIQILREEDIMVGISNYLFSRAGAITSILSYAFRKPMGNDLGMSCFPSRQKERQRQARLEQMHGIEESSLEAKFEFFCKHASSSLREYEGMRIGITKLDVIRDMEYTHASSITILMNASRCLGPGDY